MDETLVKALVANDTEIAVIQKQIIEATASLQVTLDNLLQKDRELRDAIRVAMDATGTKKFENEQISITYIAPSIRSTFDSTRFKAEHPDTYTEYLKESKVSASVRIKVKETK